VAAVLCQQRASPRLIRWRLQISRRRRLAVAMGAAHDVMTDEKARQTLEYCSTIMSSLQQQPLHHTTV
jgi:hypothetical protein